MRLISARVSGYGRLVDSKIHLDSKVIAIVGPNEAGKTTLLKALAFIDNPERLPAAQRSRAVQVTDDTAITTVVFELSDEDRVALKDLDLHEIPTRAEISRLASGELAEVTFTPSVAKSVASLREALRVLSRLARTAKNSDDMRSLGNRLQVVTKAVERAVRTVGTPISDGAITVAEELLELLAQRDLGPRWTDVDAALKLVIEWAHRDRPGLIASRRIWQRSPAFVLFDEKHRLIESSYPLDRTLADDPPAAFANLARLAGLDLGGLIDAVEADDVSRRETSIAKANRQLEKVFADAWKQTRLSVDLRSDGGLLRVHVTEDGYNVTGFGERSAGLQMYVALIAFLNRHDYGQPPILLIDEAESHLHIDAQADLVNMFVAQEQALKVIYTTHSPACLPPDLGTGVRCVVPREGDSQISDTVNSFWQGSTGFSPLMLAMGAAAAAFTPARYAVLAEGATEMILLPTLIRAATGISQLPYQVAGGLSEVPKSLMPDLDLEAARVAYLVDGDGGGAAIRKNLVQSGIPAHLIVDSGYPGLEDVIDPSAYAAAVAKLLRECNGAVANEVCEAIAADLQGWNAAGLQSLAEEHELRFPSKKALADWLVQNREARPSLEGAAVLRELHVRLLTALGMPSGAPSS